MRVKFAVMQNRMCILMVKKRMDKIIDPLIGGVGVQAQGNYQENTKKAHTRICYVMIVHA